MSSSVQEEPGSTLTPGNRRRHARYRYTAPVYAHFGDSKSIRAMTIEISESGLSAALGMELPIGDTVHLEPVGGGSVAARVRRRVGKVHGFEFVEISEDQRRRVRDACLRLPRYPDNRLGI